MKKLLCVLLVCLLLLSFVGLPCASAAENHCALFSEAINVLRWHAPDWNIQAGERFPLKYMIGYARQQLCIPEYGQELITSGDYAYYAYYAIPAEVFEAFVADSFAFVDVDALRSFTSFFWDELNFTGLDAFQNYQPELGVYIFNGYSIPNDPGRYDILGYTQADGLYTVYARFVSPIKEEPAEGEQIRIGEDRYTVEHYLQAVVAICNGRVQFHSWEELTSLPDVAVIPPLTLIAPEEDTLVLTQPGAFPGETVMEIRDLEQAQQELVQASLSGLDVDFAACSITATQQPEGSVWLTFRIPEGFDAAEMQLYFISDAGELLPVALVIDAQQGTATFALEQFGLYALTQPKPWEPVAGDLDGDGKATVADVSILLTQVMEAGEDTQPAPENMDVDGDGFVTIMDVYALLQQVMENS